MDAEFNNNDKRVRKVVNYQEVSEELMLNLCNDPEDEEHKGTIKKTKFDTSGQQDASSIKMDVKLPAVQMLDIANIGVSNDSEIMQSRDIATNPRQIKRAETAAKKREINLEFKSGIEDDKAKRFEYLLKETEVFSHFVKDQFDKKSKAFKKERGESRDKTVSIEFETTPDYIKNGQMRDYQIKGLNWLISLYENGVNGLLADEMGLGKTLQTISFLGYLKHHKKINGPFILIVPKSTLEVWKDEFARWCPSMVVFDIIGTKAERDNIIMKKLKNQKFNWDACITTYQSCVSEFGRLRNRNWHCLITDEAHRYKNENSQFSQVTRRFKTKHRLLLTGTPLQNNLHQLWAVLNFLLPDVFKSSDDFDNWFNTASCLNDERLVDRLQKILQPFFLRRIKSEVERDIPPKKEIKVFVPLAPEQRKWYKKVLMNDLTTIMGDGSSKKTRLSNLLMHLRKVCNHPFLFENAEPYPYETENLVVWSGKMWVLDKLLSKLKAEGSKVLIFSQFTTMLRILEDLLYWRGYSYYVFEGKTDYKQRAKDVKAFNTPGNDTFIYLLSTRAGGLGITLTAADTVIFYDSDFNPQSDMQAMDRAHRIGQTKQVNVYRLITENTIEERMIEVADLKLYLDTCVIQKGLLDKESLLEMQAKWSLDIVRFGADDIIKNEDGSTALNLNDENFEKILTRSLEKTSLSKNKYDELLKNPLMNIYMEGLDPTIICRNFEGVFFKNEDAQDGLSVIHKRVPLTK